MGFGERRSAEILETSGFTESDDLSLFVLPLVRIHFSDPLSVRTQDIHRMSNVNGNVRHHRGSAFFRLGRRARMSDRLSNFFGVQEYDKKESTADSESNFEILQHERLIIQFYQVNLGTASRMSTFVTDFVEGNTPRRVNTEKWAEARLVPREEVSKANRVLPEDEEICHL